MIRTQHPRPARPGFTLVELMVSAAICVIIMTILAVCFQTGIDAMREMRSAGDMTDQLRAAGEVMKRDFLADHFLPAENVPGVLNQGRRLSDYQFQAGATAASVRGGFYQISSPASFIEGQDGNGFNSTRADPVSTGTPQGHTVWFTSVLPGGSEANVYSAVSPAATGQLYSSQAAEICYFLAGFGTSPNTPTGSANGIPTYNLYRRQRLVAMDTITQAALQQAVAADTSAAEVFSLYQPPMGTPTVNTMADVPANGGKRPAFPSVLSSANRYGDDILLSNVISFEVKPTWQPTTSITPFPANSDYPYDNLAAFSNQFDTATTPPAIRVVGIQIRVRVYDPKLKTARQATYVFDQ